MSQTHQVTEASEEQVFVFVAAPIEQDGSPATPDKHIFVPARSQVEQLPLAFQMLEERDNCRVLALIPKAVAIGLPEAIEADEGVQVTDLPDEQTFIFIAAPLQSDGSVAPPDQFIICPVRSQIAQLPLAIKMLEERENCKALAILPKDDVCGLPQLIANFEAANQV